MSVKMSAVATVTDGSSLPSAAKIIEAAREREASLSPLVEALQESAFLLTIAWPEETEKV